MPAYTEFEFDLPGALLKNLVKIIHSLQPEPLRMDTISAIPIPEEQGVYQLLLDTQPVYVGKTDQMQASSAG